MASGFPERVPAWYMGPSGETICIISVLAPYAPTGSPPPIIFPRQVMSGVTPNSSCAPPLPRRNPVMTSSKMRTAPCFLHVERSRLRKFFSGVTTPMFPATGSIITPAIFRWCFSKSFLTESMSLYRASSVLFTNDLGTPALLGFPKVVAPEPDFTSRKSECPW